MTHDEAWAKIREIAEKQGLEPGAIAGMLSVNAWDLAKDYPDSGWLEVRDEYMTLQQNLFRSSSKPT